MTQGRAKSSFLIALGVSLAVHATFMVTFGRYPVGRDADWARDSSGGSRAGEMTVVLVPDPQRPDGPEVVAEPPPPGAKLEPSKEADAEPETSKEEAPPALKPPEPNEFQVGEQTGTGYALHEVKGDQVPLAPKAENDQARLSRDPVGEFGEGMVSTPQAGGAASPSPSGPPAQMDRQTGAPQPGPVPPVVVLVTPPPARPERTPPAPAPAESEPTPAATPPANVSPAPPTPRDRVAPSDRGETEPPAHEAKPRGRAATPKISTTEVAPAIVKEPAPQAPPVRAREARPNEATDERRDPPADQADPPPPVEPRRAQVAVAVPVTPPPSLDRANAEPARPSAPGPRGPVNDGSSSAERAAGDPLPPSDSDSDAFSQFAGSAVLRQGRLEVQFGRKVKSRRPRFNTGGIVDLIYDQHGVDVVLSVATDASGKVTSVKVRKSSGSAAIDQPIVVSMYDWWFEPPKDRDGRPKPDQFKFTIGLR